MSARTTVPSAPPDKRGPVGAPPWRAVGQGTAAGEGPPRHGGVDEPLNPTARPNTNYSNAKKGELAGQYFRLAVAKLARVTVYNPRRGGARCPRGVTATAPPGRVALLPPRITRRTPIKRRANYGSASPKVGQDVIYLNILRNV